MPLAITCPPHGQLINLLAALLGERVGWFNGWLHVADASSSARALACDGGSMSSAGSSCRISGAQAVQEVWLASRCLPRWGHHSNTASKGAALAAAADAAAVAAASVAVGSTEGVWARRLLSRDVALLVHAMLPLLFVGLTGPTASSCM